tara:strand:- start:98 stop:877 length:780 start_codon:yes stop_codon:yes gene_type:complete
MISPVNQLNLECCKNTLSRLENGDVDVVITSPPYNLNLRLVRGQHRSRQIDPEDFSTKYQGFNDNLSLEEYNTFHSEILFELLRVSKLVFYNVSIVTGSKQSIFKMIGEFSKELKEIIVWDKKHTEPAMGAGVLNRRTELILVFQNSDRAIYRQFKDGKFKRGTLNDIWQIPRGKKPDILATHGAIMPERLVSCILENFSREGDVVYDPFMGTGTTGVVAVRMQRKFIGSELVPEYFEVAKHRIQEEGKQSRLVGWFND